MSSDASLQQRQETALSDLSSLGRVSHRLAMTEAGAPLQKVLNVLLPRLLQRIGSNHQLQQDLKQESNSGDAATSSRKNLEDTYTKIHAKLVEMLSHVMKRVRADKDCPLPCRAILALLFENDQTFIVKQSVDPFTMNLALAFLTMGLPRCSKQNVEKLIPGLMVLVGHYDSRGITTLQSASQKAQSHQLHHLLLRAMEAVITSGEGAAAADSSKNAQDKQDYTKTARHVLASNEVTAGAVYDLILSVLLYQPSAGNVPPPGLSQACHEMLLGGTSSTAKNWGAEMASPTRLKDLKLALLDYIAPCKKWAVFLKEENNTSGDENDGKADSNDNNTNEGSSSLGTARAVALLVVASGDAHVSVADRASLFLKAHLDSDRGGSTGSDSALGSQPLLLATHLISLVLGETNAEACVANHSTKPATLGIAQAAGDQTAIRLSMKRRMTGEKTSCAALNFCSKMLEENPQLLNTDAAIEAFASLAVTVCHNLLLSSPNNSSTMRLSNSPYVAAAKLMNSVTVRLSSYYDTRNNNNNMVGLFSKSLSIACSVLAGSASTNEGTVATRDSCYGVVCTLSRSRFALARQGGIFSCGGGTTTTTSANTIASTAVSIETAALLFGCASTEVEALRTRAVAALDALLGAYCRVYNNKERRATTQGVTKMEVETNTDTSNPWASQMTTSSNASNRLASEYNTDNKAILSKSLLPLLWTAAQSSQPKASRVAAARWSTDLLKLLDVPNASHILCFLTGDDDVTASNIAREGLGLLQDEENGLDSKSGSTVLPDFSDLTAVLFESHPSGGAKQSSSSWRPQYFDFSLKGKAGAVKFGLKCLYNDLYGGEDEAIASYVSVLTETLSWFTSSNQAVTTGQEAIVLLEECSVCLAGCLSTSKFARSMLVSGKSFGLETMEALVISADSSKARRYLAEACGQVYQDYTLWCDSSSDGPCTLSDWVASCKISRPMEMCARKLDDMQSNLFMAGEVHGAIFLGARCVRAFRLLTAAQSDIDADQPSVNACWEFSETILTALGRGTLHSDEVLGNACSNGLVIALSYVGVDAPILDKHLYSGCATALASLNTSLRRYGNGDHTDPTRATLLAEATGMVLAGTTSGAGHVSSNESNIADLGPARIQCVDALFSVLGSSAFRKDPEIALVAGEALALYSDAFSPEGAVWTFAPSDWPEDYDETYANELPPHQQTLYLLLRREMNSSSPHKRTACATALLALSGRAAKTVNGNAAMAKRAFVRELLARLGDIQAAFITLLAYPKSKQLARESCCLGLAACQGLADAVAAAGEDTMQDANVSRGLNDRLLKAFGQTTNYGGSAMMETRSQETERRRRENRETDAAEASATSLVESFGMETEVGGASGLGEAALGAYREMASAAMALGRPDVLYALMLLSVSHPVWFTEGCRDRYSAASLLGENSIVGNRTNATEIRNALRPHLQALIPRLLRACNDPNKQTRDQMGSLWAGLTGGGAESRLAITHHLLPTIDALIEDTSHKLWRARVGACGALTEVIVGRSWDDLGGGGPVLDDDDVLNPTKGTVSTAALRLLRLWRAATRALDDVRLTVRESGESLARSVRTLTIRLTDPTVLQKSAEESLGVVTNETKAKIEHDTSAAAATSLRWLVKHGLNQACDEATGACVSCLLGIIDVVEPKQLQPVLPELIGSLLMAMSGLEPAALNYLQVRTAGRDSGASYDRLERMRLQLAQSGPIAGALTKCLDMMRFLDVDAQKAVIPQLDSALRCGAGFATRAAAADAVSSLCTTCPSAFRFPGQSSTNPTVRLLRALYFASERERGLGARDKMAHALGNLAALSPGPSVRSLALRACERYSLAQGNNDDPAARRAAAAALRAMAVRATPQFADGGANDIWCRRVLPIAFIGQRDSDTKVASLWQEVWDEGGSAANVSARSTGADDFGVLLEEKLLPYLVRACIEALDDVSWSRRIAGCAALMELADLNVLTPAPRSIGSSTVQQTGETPSVVRARRRAQASRAALHACVKLMVKSRIWAGKGEVVKATVKVAGKWTMVTCGEQVNCSDFGWDGNGAICPWAPLSISVNQGSDDLFLGDGWFQEEHQLTEEAEVASGMEEVTKSNDERQASGAPAESSDEVVKIDFEDCEKILGDESSPSGAEVEPDNAEKEDASKVLTFSGLCRALIEQGMPTAPRQSLASSPDDVLPYRAAALHGLADLLNSLDSGGASQRRSIYRMIATTLIGVIDTENVIGVGNFSRSDEPPLILARSIDCLAAAMWEGIGGDQDSPLDNGRLESPLDLSQMLRSAGGKKQPAWTVRESSVLGAAVLAARCDSHVLRKHDLISVLLDCIAQAMKDRKFWRVRYAGLKLLHTLVSRAGSTNNNSTAFSMTGSSSDGSNTGKVKDCQLLLEALLPHKENILKIARASLTDSEVKVTSIGTDVCGAMAWWP